MSINMKELRISVAHTIRQRVRQFDFFGRETTAKRLAEERAKLFEVQKKRAQIFREQVQSSDL